MNIRLKEILRILLISTSPITVNKISEELGVSNKTIRNDLDKLDDYVEREGLLLIRKRGVGISIEGPNKTKVLLLEKIKDKDVVYIEPFSPNERKAYILKALFLNGKNITYRKLAEELYVSTNTIYKDLKKVEQWLENYNLMLDRRRNYIDIIGEEANYRKAISNFIQEIKKLNNMKEEFYSEYDGRIDYNTLKQLKVLMNLDYKAIEELLVDIEKELDFKFSQEAFINLIVHIAISIKRIQENKDITMSNETFNSINHTEEFRCAKEMANEMEKLFSIKIPKFEIGYITLHILGSKRHEKELENLNFSFEETNGFKLPLIMAKNIINIASEALKIDLTKDQNLLNGLVLHLRPTINRLKYGLTLKNPILDEIKEDYPEIYGVSWITSVVFEKYLDIKIPESEIGYIAIHIGAAVERNKKRIRCLVVCHTGIGTSQLLLAKLERRFKELEIVGVRSSTKLNTYKLKDIDLIISTVPIQENKESLIVSPILNEYDIERLENFIFDYYNMTVYKSEDLLCKEIFFRRCKFSNKEDILFEMCQTLKERQYLKDGFEETVIKRERIMTTEVGKKFAIPHGDPKKVQKSCIALTVLEHPVIWKNEYVEFILMVCLTENDLYKGQSIFRNLNYFMDQDEFLKKLKAGYKSVKDALDRLESN